MFDYKEIRNALYKKLFFRVFSWCLFGVVLLFLYKQNYILAGGNFLLGIIFHLLYQLQNEKDNGRIYEGMLHILIQGDEELVDKVEKTYIDIIEKTVENYNKDEE